jgi:hypothetical protein
VRLRDTKASSIPHAEWNVDATNSLFQNALRLSGSQQMGPARLDCRGDAAKVWRRVAETEPTNVKTANTRGSLKNRYGVTVIWNPMLRVEGS